MDIKDLKCFAAVYEERSINRAAGKLFITSQGLGKVIHKLEEELDITLFERSKKGVAPTQGAAFLYENQGNTASCTGDGAGNPSD